MFFQIVIVALSPNTDAGYKFVFHSNTSFAISLYLKGSENKNVRFGRNTKSPARSELTERVGLLCLDQDIDSDFFPLTCLEVVDARYGFDKLAGVRFIDGQFSDF